MIEANPSVSHQVLLKQVEKVVSRSSTLIGFGSFFRSGSTQIGDVDVVEILPCSGNLMTKKLTKLPEHNLDLTSIGANRVETHMFREAQYGFQYLSRAISGGVFIRGSRDEIDPIVAKAEGILAANPHDYALRSVLDHASKVASTISNMQRLRPIDKKLAVISVFDRFTRIWAFNKGYWYVPSLYSHHWGLEEQRFYSDVLLRIEQALLGDESGFLRLLIDELETLRSISHRRRQRYGQDCHEGSRI